jgi:hypothetical protein
MPTLSLLTENETINIIRPRTTEHAKQRTCAHATYNKQQDDSKYDNLEEIS